MSVKTIGNQNVLTLQPDQSLTMAPDGSGEAKLSYKCGWSKVATYIPKPLQSHPDFPSLLLYEFTTVREPGDIGRFDCIYRGVIADEPMKLMQEEATMTTSSEPLESHPRYAGYRDKDGNMPMSPPVTTSQIAEIQKALETNATSYTSTNPLAVELWKKKRYGMDSYLRVGTTYKSNFCQPTAPTKSDYSEVGKRWQADAVSGTFKNAPIPQSDTEGYLQTEFSWRKMGGAFYITVGLQMSGPNGWDNIYDYKTT